MYAIKASWVGRTFALATTNDSGGRKSRIRRSKEERKAMVESFIKRYQILNDGNFPSLNLTHKEVGGSFYTVREIVREIIQENRVLGPAGFSDDVQKGHTVAEDYSSGSSSSQAQIVLSVNKLDEYQKNDSLGLTLAFNGHCTNHQDLDSFQCSTEQWANEMSEDSDELARKSLNEKDQQYESLELSLNNVVQFVNENRIDDTQFANVTQSNGVSKESDEILGEGPLVSGTSQGDIQKGLLGACNAELTLPTKELEVETFPLRPAIKEIDGMSSISTGSVNVNGTLNNVGTKHNEISNGVPQLNKFVSPDSLSDMVTAKGVGGSEPSTTVPGIVYEQAEINDKMIQGEEASRTNKTLEMLASSAIRDKSPDKSPPRDQGCVDRVASCSGSRSNTIEQSEEIDGFQSRMAPKGMTCLENSSSGTSNKITSKAPVSGVANGSYIQKENRAMSGASPTLDRIDLESWESKKTSHQETNPLLAFFKAFVDALVRFWSE